jgi:hypothetical protein
MDFCSSLPQTAIAVDAISFTILQLVIVLTSFSHRFSAAWSDATIPPILTRQRGYSL